MTITACTILLVDDEEANLDLLEAVLEPRGYERLVRVSDAREAVATFDAVRPDLVLLDLHMPHRSGFEVLADLCAQTPDDEFLPIVVLTADVTPEARDRALAEGAHDFIHKPFDRGEVLLRVRNLLRTRLLHLAERRARAAAERAAARDRLLAEAGRALAGPVDPAAGLAEAVALLVPALADAAAVDLAREGAWWRAASAGAHPPAAPAQPPGARDAEPPADTRTLCLTATAGNDAALALTLVRDGARPPFDDAERALAGELVRRVALADEGARLFRELQQAVAGREHLLAVVAHDLRNPLAAARLYLERLRTSDPTDRLAAGAPAPADLVARTDRTLAQMEALIEDLLDAARLARGTMVLKRRPHDLADLLAEAAAWARPLIERRGLRLVVEGPSAIPPTHVDGRRLLQALSNLLGNATKFAATQVTFAWTLDADTLHVVVADDGPGIPADQLPHLFAPYWQGRTADQRGLGLGLSIALGVAEAHDGRLWVESRPSEGTRLVLALPLDTAATP